MNKFKEIMTLPNWLSLGRIGAVPVLVLLLGVGEGGRGLSIVSAILFLVAVLTDLLDGFLARRWKLVTNLGRFLDPLADKLLISSALIMLIPLDRAAAWVVFLIIGREIAITGLRGIAAAEGVVIDASLAGKQKALTQNVAIFLLLWHYPVWGVNLHVVGSVILYLALIATYWSGYAYFREFFLVFLEQSEEKGIDKAEEK
ncbi:MAG: CDP-diacylglycerol--glycerol-3-phosphate 3-phosphatidyltransferase [Pseudomonadota bacterium]